jgi:hypothetical protein
VQDMGGAVRRDREVTLAMSKPAATTTHGHMTTHNQQNMIAQSLVARQVPQHMEETHMTTREALQRITPHNNMTTTQQQQQQHITQSPAPRDAAPQRREHTLTAREAPQRIMGTHTTTRAAPPHQTASHNKMSASSTSPSRGARAPRVSENAVHLTSIPATVKVTEDPTSRSSPLRYGIGPVIWSPEGQIRHRPNNNNSAEIPSPRRSRASTSITTTRTDSQSKMMRQSSSSSSISPTRRIVVSLSPSNVGKDGEIRGSGDVAPARRSAAADSPSPPHSVREGVDRGPIRVYSSGINKDGSGSSAVVENPRLVQYVRDGDVDRGGLTPASIMNQTGAPNNQMGAVAAAAGGASSQQGGVVPTQDVAAAGAAGVSRRAFRPDLSGPPPQSVRTPAARRIFTSSDGDDAATSPQDARGAPEAGHAKTDSNVIISTLPMTYVHDTHGENDAVVSSRERDAFSALSGYHGVGEAIVINAGEQRADMVNVQVGSESQVQLQRGGSSSSSAVALDSDSSPPRGTLTPTKFMIL